MFRPASPTAPANIDVRIDPGLVKRAHLALRPSWPRRTWVSVAGWRDGFADVVPDPDSGGHTSFTAGLQNFARTGAQAELLELDVVLSRIGEQLARLAEESAACAAERDAAHGAAAEPLPDLDLSAHPAVPEHIRRTRLTRAHHRRVQELRGLEKRAIDRIAGIAAETAALHELADKHKKTTRERIQRWADSCQQLVCGYWRALLRTHPEAAAISDTHAVPVVSVPGVDGPVPAGLVEAAGQHSE